MAIFLPAEHILGQGVVTSYLRKSLKQAIALIFVLFAYLVVNHAKHCCGG
jgi:hypothetical protein